MVRRMVKQAKLKHRVVRWLNKMSERMRPTYTPVRPGLYSSEIDRVVEREMAQGNHLHLVEFSLVSHCPYCGSSDWDTPVKKPNGSICNHPTRLREVK